MPESRLHSRDDWHRADVSELPQLLGTDLDAGLSPAEAGERLKSFGPNTITKRGGKSRLRLLLSQFSQTLVLILIVAGIVTAVLREYVDSGVIFGVVIINALVGFLQESKAVRAIEALSRSMTAEATVIRGGQRLRMSATDLVPGDLVVLQAGDKVPADLRLTYSRDLRVDESALTGESVPVEKQVAPLDEDTALADRTNMVYASALATAGQGTGVVVATGDATEVGKISGLIAEAEELKTPLTRKIAQFSRLLLYVIIGLAVVTALVGILRGEPVVDMFVAAVALAVGAIPEGLPAAVTIVLAIGVSRMARRKAIIRRLPAVETLGSTTVICSDKTGTLTENQMTVQKVAVAGRELYLSGGGYDPQGGVYKDDASQDDAPLTVSSPEAGPELLELFRAGLLCNDSSVYFEDGTWHISGDPTEAALIVSAMKAGLNREVVEHHMPRLDTLPFESEYQYMATLHRGLDAEGTGGDRAGNVIYVKGAVERILDRASQNADGSPLDAAAKRRVEQESRALAAEGLRVLAFACKRVPDTVTEITHDDIESDLVFLGLQGMIDPPRAEALHAVRACREAGIQVKMITGDHVVTAAAIGKRLELGTTHCHDGDEPKALTGAELAAVSDEDLVQTAAETVVFARVTPEQKLRLVRALQARGNVVAMTGDGVNDGPALRQADIGVAMGITGTEVAKEAADMVLTDDNFASIEAAVEEGRGVFDNLMKFITWTLPTNLAEGLVILAAIFAGTVLPILPKQILWVNMTTGVVLGITLAFEAKERGIMNRPPRKPDTPLLDGMMIGRILIVGVLLLGGAFGLFEYTTGAGYTTEQARTVAVNVIVFGEIFFLFSCRSLLRPSWKSGFRTNPILFAGVAAMIGLQMLFTYVPAMNALFSTAPISAPTWLYIVGVGVLVHLVMETEKWIRRRREARRVPTGVC
jgi:Ca2+-transporting ATPase